jgi:hypothetical protein
MSEPSTQKLKRRSMNQHRAALSLSDRETTIKQLCSNCLFAPSSSSFSAGVARYVNTG